MSGETLARDNLDVLAYPLTDPITMSLKGRVERIFFFASFKLPLFNEYEMVFIIA